MNQFPFGPPQDLPSPDPKLNLNDYDIVDIVPVPMHGDRMVRLRTIEETLEELINAADGEVSGFIVQVKPKRGTEGGTQVAQALTPPPPPSDAAIPAQAPAHAQAKGVPAAVEATATQIALGDATVYLPDGKLNVSFLMKNAEILAMSRDFTLARNIYKAILQSGERTAAAHLGLGRCFEAEDRIEEARIHYEESIAYHPAPEAFQQLASVLIRKGKDQQAAETLERALTLKDLDAHLRFEFHKACGNCWMRTQGSIESAERHFRQALGLRPDAEEIRTNIGALYLQANRISEAKRSFQDALAANSRNDKALAGLGSCLLAEGDKRQAHDCFARALDIKLNNPLVVLQLVKCAYELKSFATAARILEDYTQIAPVSANLMYSLAGLQFHLGRMDDARATARRILELAPQHVGATDLLGLIDRFAGQPRPEKQG